MLTLANAGWYIWSNRFVPMSDYPDWLYQGWLFSRILRGTALPQFEFKHYPVPYATLVTVGMGLLDLVTPPEAAGKITLCLIISLFWFASTYMLRSLQVSEQNPLLLVPVLLILNSYFFWGELSFLVGIGFFFLYCGYLFRRLDDFDSISILSFTVWSMLLYFSHLLPYLFAILVTAYVAYAGLSWRRVLRLSAAILPSAVAVGWYAAARIKAHNLGAGPLWIWWTPHLIEGRFLGAFSPYPQFLPTFGIRAPYMGFAAILNLFVCGLIVAIWIICVAAWIEGRRTRGEILALAAAFLAGFVLAGFAFAGMVSPGERFLYPAAWLAMTWLGLQWRPDECANFSRVAMIILAALIISQGLLIETYGRGASQELGRAYRQLAAAGSRAEFCEIYRHYVSLEQSRPHRQGLERFLTGPSGFRRLPYYLFIERGESAPIFPIGIFNYDGPGNNEDLCSDFSHA